MLNDYNICRFAQLFSQLPALLRPCITIDGCHWWCTSSEILCCSTDRKLRCLCNLAQAVCAFSRPFCTNTCGKYLLAVNYLPILFGEVLEVSLVQLASRMFFPCYCITWFWFWTWQISSRYFGYKIFCSSKSARN